MVPRNKMTSIDLLLRSIMELGITPNSPDPWSSVLITDPTLILIKVVGKQSSTLSTQSKICVSHLNAKMQSDFGLRIAITFVYRGLCACYIQMIIGMTGKC